MGTPLYNTDIIPMTSRPTLTVMDDGDYFVILDTSTGKISKILKTNIMTALKITYDNTSGLTAETVQAALDELVVNLGSTNTVIESLKGVGWTDENLVDHEERLDTLEGTGAGSVAKAIDDAVSPLQAEVDTNRLYSDSQYLALKAQADAQALEIQASRAELYNGYKILQFGSTDIIGKGTKADYSAVDVSANVVDGKLSMEQKGLTIRNGVVDGAFESGTTTAFPVLNGSGGTISTEKAYIGTNSIKLLANNNFCNNYQEIACKTGDVILYGCWVYKESGTGALVYALPKGAISGSLNVAMTEQNFADQTAGTWKRYVGLATATNDGIRVVAGRATNATFTAYFDGFVHYNLSNHGLASITSTTILAQLLPYVDGTANVGKMGLLVRGKNWFSSFEKPLRIDNTTPNAEDVVCNIVDVSILKQFTCSFKLNGSTRRIRIQSFDASGVQISATGRGIASIDSPVTGSADTVYNSVYFKEIVNNTQASVTFTFSATAHTAKINVIDTSGTSEIQLEVGASATTFAPYSAQTIFLPAIGNSLPNGTADSIKTVSDGWEHSKRVSTPTSVGSGVAVNTTNYPTAKDGGQWVNELTAGGTEIGVVGTDSTTGAGMLRFELATPIVTKYDLPLPTSGKTVHRFAGEEKIALYGTGLTFSENVLTVLSAVKFVAGVMTDITSLATITTNTVTFSGVGATDVVYVKVEHDVDRPLGVLEHTPAVSNTASRLASLEARVSALEV